MPQDRNILKLLDTYRPKMTALQQSILGRTKVLLDGRTESCRRRECNFGNFITDSMVFEYAIKQQDQSVFWTDAPIAFVQGGGIRSSIDTNTTEGSISKLDANEVLPFNNNLVTTVVTGQSIIDALEWSVRRYSMIENNGEFLQMSGVRVHYDLSRDSFDRVTSVEVLCGECEVPKYSKIDPMIKYKIIITSFIHEGGDGFDMLKVILGNVFFIV